MKQRQPKSAQIINFPKAKAERQAKAEGAASDFHTLVLQSRADGDFFTEVFPSKDACERAAMSVSPDDFIIQMWSGVPDQLAFGRVEHPFSQYTPQGVPSHKPPSHLGQVRKPDEHCDGGWSK